VAYQDEVLADNPIGYWRLGEASGTLANNLGSLGNPGDGTYSNTGALTLGEPGALVGDADTSVLFSAAGDGYVNIPHDNAFSISNITLEAWIKTTDAGSTFNKDIIDRDDGDIRWYQFALSDSGELVIAIWTGGGTLVFIVSTGASLNDGAWHHVVATYDQVDLRLWSDGVNIDTLPETGVLDNPGALTIEIGKHHTGSVNNSWNGHIDEVAIYGAALTGTRIIAHYDAGTTAGNGAPAPLPRILRSGLRTA
jgi:concanavalin A-like lectin/glucanase superfamily protein